MLPDVGKVLKVVLSMTFNMYNFLNYVDTTAISHGINLIQMIVLTTRNSEDKIVDCIKRICLKVFVSVELQYLSAMIIPEYI